MRMTTNTEAPGFVIPTFTTGDRLRKARQLTGLEQADFADELGISRGTVRNYELDHVAPRKIVLRAWAMRTGVPLQWLVNGETPDPHEADRGFGVLPRLDLNQRPSDYTSSQVSHGTRCDVTPLRKASGTARARRVRRHGEGAAA